MTTRAKSAVVATALAALTLWPLGHLWLVARYDLSPWKLAGWGMYAAPRSRSLGMEVFGHPRGGSPEHLSQPAPATRGLASQYLERHRWLRKLVRPTDLAAAIGAERPSWDEIKIVVFEPHLDRRSGMIVMSALLHRYERTPAGIAYAGEEDARTAGLPPALLQQLGIH